MPAPTSNKKYIQVLEAARALFWKHGFRRVSIEEVCKSANVSKMTFYRFFPNKIELAKAVFDREAYQGVQRFRNLLAEPSDPGEKIRKLILMKTEGTHEISREFLKDFYADKELGLKEFIEEKTREIWGRMLEDFKTAQEEGIFRKDMKPEFFIYLSQKIGEAIADEKLLNLYESPRDLVIELTNFVSYGISPREEQRKGMA